MLYFGRCLNDSDKLYILVCFNDHRAKGKLVLMAGLIANIDETLCIGCGICEGAVPEVFSLANGPIAEVIVNPVPETLRAATEQAAQDCPEAAILLNEETKGGEVETSAVPETTAESFVAHEAEVEEPFSLHPIERNNMKAFVDKDLCIGCGICEGIAPEVFSLQTEPYAVVIMDPLEDAYVDAAKEAEAECPEGAIKVE